MALIVCHIIAYIQILSAGYNLWGVDPRILVNMPFGRNTILVGLFMVVQLLGLTGAILMLQKHRLGLLLSLIHHILLLPALVVTGWGLVMLMDDRINLTLLFMSKPSGSDVSLFWSLGWTTVFQQVTRNVPTGSTYIGINLFAFACATVLWAEMERLAAIERAQRAAEMRRRRQQARLRLPPPQRAPQQYPPQYAQPYTPPPPRPRPPEPMRQSRRSPWREY